MSTFSAVALTVSLIVLGSALVFILEHRAKVHRREDSRRYEQSLDNPAFDVLEQHFKHPLPASLKKLYSNKDLIHKTDILVAVPNPIEKEKECHIAFFEPATAPHAASPSPSCEGLFAFANNGAGDQFLVDPRQADPEVIYYLHDTGEKNAIG